MSKSAITLEDFEIRYKNIRQARPKVRQCTVRGCNNPRDSTKHLGENTCCAYHRLLFDYWMSEVVELDKVEQYLKSQKGKRRAFTNWRNRTGEAMCDEIVLKMAKEPINWEC